VPFGPRAETVSGLEINRQRREWYVGRGRQVIEANGMDDISVSDAENLKDNGENPPPYLLVIVGEPFSEEDKAAIAHRIATGLLPPTGKNGSV